MLWFPSCLLLLCFFLSYLSHVMNSENGIPITVMSQSCDSQDSRRKICFSFEPYWKPVHVSKPKIKKRSFKWIKVQDSSVSCFIRSSVFFQVPEVQLRDRFIIGELIILEPLCKICKVPQTWTFSSHPGERFILFIIVIDFPETF